MSIHNAIILILVQLSFHNLQQFEMFRLHVLFCVKFHEIFHVDTV